MNKQETIKVEAKCTELRELLLEFGVALHGFDPGILGVITESNISICLDNMEWAWLEPLLKELREYRKNN